MLKIDMDKALKIGGMVLTIAGTIVSAVASGKEQEKLISKAVEEHLAQK